MDRLHNMYELSCRVVTCVLRVHPNNSHQSCLELMLNAMGRRAAPVVKKRLAETSVSSSQTEAGVARGTVLSSQQGGLRF